ncbi:MAG: CRISPR-associated helicase Cas3' [Cystobacterineae bacterium]|nr:CRISPR-associated helicase Cas3' [Cystobacterineae bacterium]
MSVHLKDTAEVAKRLWKKWLPEAVRQTVAKSIGADEQEAQRLVLFLAVAHDIGKATPVFQAKCSFPKTDLDEAIYDRLLMSGFKLRESSDKYSFSSQTPHALASQLLLEKAKPLGLSEENLCRNAAVILGSHHGKPPDNEYEKVLGAYQINFGCGVEAWICAQRELIALALECGGYKSLAEVPCPSMPGQVLLSGLLIMADWIASDTDKFPLISLDCPLKMDSAERARFGWEELKLPNKWDPCVIRSDEGLYVERFGYEPNEMQKAALQAARNLRKPGIMVIEAPMGLGKTEAALVVAEVFRNRTDSGGIFFALPTQATSDGIFPRMTNWIENLDFDFDEKHSINLVHGKAQFNKDFCKLFEGKSEVSGSDDNSEERLAFVHQWFNGRKKAMLADFVVGTVDQLLLVALKQKHVMLRHLGLAGKVVIIDECHAYDAYMNQYLKMALRWLGAYGVPVVVLSATLPADTRREVIGAYLGKENLAEEWTKSLHYPLITCSDGDEVKCCAVGCEGKGRSVQVEYLAREVVADKLEDLLSGGGCAGVIMDTVARSQEMARVLRERFGADKVRLIHSRFIATDRLAKEGELREALGKKGKRPDKRIVVGTQVLEQSLDIDFDVMVTDIAPMDLLLQRMGRLHRHERRRPEKLKTPRCFLTGIDKDGFERGIDSVYDKHLLLRTRDLLDGRSDVSLPEDIAPLVNAAYDKKVESTQEKEAWEKKIRNKEEKAKTFRIGSPMRKPDKTIVNWLRTGVEDGASGKKGEATVRDTDESIEVLVVQEKGDGFFFITQTPLSSEKLPLGELSAELARRLSTQSLRLPALLCYPYIIDQVVKELETQTHERLGPWLKSPWLSGELFLIVDNNNSASLCGYKISYTQDDGLVCTKEDT